MSHQTRPLSLHADIEIFCNVIKDKLDVAKVRRESQRKSISYKKYQLQLKVNWARIRTDVA